MFLDHDLDVTTTEIVSRADESDQSRRKLVELSRDLKKNINELKFFWRHSTIDIFNHPATFFIHEHTTDF
ncbi:hypothetical protein I4U23_008109 [Adineta vaga]|nr:hypothetical protein I4U23_008109 [Adineta vaga]